MSYVRDAAMLVGTPWSLRVGTGVFRNSLNFLTMFRWLVFPMSHENFT